MSTTTYLSQSTIIPGQGEASGFVPAPPAGAVSDTSTEVTAGAGINGETAVLPDVPTRQAASGALIGVTYQSLLQSIDGNLPRLNNDDSALLIQEVLAAIDTGEKEVLQERIRNMTEKRRDDIKEHGEKLTKSLKAQERAARKSGFAKLFSKVAAYVAGALMAAVGAALTVTGVGAAAGAALMAIGTMMILDQVLKDTTGKGVAGNLVSALGGSDQAANWADVGFGVALAIASVAVAPMTGGTTVLTAVTAITGIVNGIMQAGSTALNLDAGLTQAAAMRKEADVKKFEAQSQTEQAFSDMALQLLIASMKRIASILDTGAEALQDRGDTLSRAKLTA